MSKVCSKFQRVFPIFESDFNRFALHNRLKLRDDNRSEIVIFVFTYFIEESTAPQCRHVQQHGNGACTLTPDGDLARVTTEGRDVVLNPVQGKTLVL